MKPTCSLWALAVGCGHADKTDSTEDVFDPNGLDIDCCDIPGNLCTWLGVPGVAMFSGEGTDTSQDPVTGTYLYLPQDITFAADGTAYYEDFNYNRIRKVSTDGFVTTVSGTGFLGDGPAGAVVDCWSGCNAMDSAWRHPTDVTADPSDSTQLYVAAWQNSRINRIDLVAATMTWFAGTGGRFYNDGVVPETAALAGDEQEFELSRAVLNLPSSVAFGPDGTLYFSDQANHLVRKIAPGSDRVEIAAGSIMIDIDLVTGLPAAGPFSVHRQPGFEGDGGDALLAKLHGYVDGHADPSSKLVVDGSRLLIADTVNEVIREIDLDTGIIDTIAGKYTSAGLMTVTDAISGETYEADAGSVPGYSGDGGDPLDAVFNMPRDVAVGLEGEIYVADTKNHCVRVIRDGTIDTFAGSCDPDAAAAAYSGDCGPATEAEFSDVFGVAVDALGTVYIADSGNHIIRRVRP